MDTIYPPFLLSRRRRRDSSSVVVAVGAGGSFFLWDPKQEESNLLRGVRPLEPARLLHRRYRYYIPLAWWPEKGLELSCFCCNLCA